MSETDEFSVWLFFPDGTHMAEKRWIGPQEACELVRDITLRPAARVGLITRIIIVDGNDFTSFEWQYGKGVTYPPRGADGRFYVPPEDETPKQPLSAGPDDPG